MTIEEALNRIEKIVGENSCSQILDQHVYDEIESIRQDIKAEQPVTD